MKHESHRNININPARPPATVLNNRTYDRHRVDPLDSVGVIVYDVCTTTSSGLYGRTVDGGRRTHVELIDLLKSNKNIYWRCVDDDCTGVILLDDGGVYTTTHSV